MVVRHLAVSFFYYCRAKLINGVVVGTYHSSQIAANVLFILIPLYYVLRKKSSRRTKIIAGVILGLVVLGLIGELGAKLTGAK